MRWRLRSGRPVDQDPSRIDARVAVVAVEQHDERRFQPLGGMHGQDLHGIKTLVGDFGINSIRRLCVALHAFVWAFILVALADGAEFSHELRQARIPATVQIERELQERIQVGEHLIAVRGRCALGIAALEFAGVDDVIEQIVHRQRARHRQPARQHAMRVAQGVRRIRLAGQRGQALPPCQCGRAFAKLRQCDEVLVRGGENGAAQHMRKRQICLRRHQEIEQRA